MSKVCPLTSIAITTNSPFDDRLRLFREVCSAVQYAHQNLVIHRDLKPGNILITREGLPRLLDFGIAKLLNPECFQTPLITQTDWRPMTPGYASPEQVRGDAVTSATDVYSLGVLLYEILTGYLPYKVADSSWREIERLVCEQEPPRPSTRVSTDGERLKATAETRRAEPKQLVRLLRGDLDWITMKALEKDPVRRYATVFELSADIGRHLSHEPVLARPASAALSGPEICPPSSGRRDRGRRISAAAGRVCGYTIVPVTPHHARARSSEPHHGIHGGNVQSLGPERGARQQHHCPGDSGQGVKRHRHGAGAGPGTPGPDDVRHGRCV